MRLMWTLISLQGNEGHVDTILTATDKLFGSMGDTPEMVRQARILAQVRVLDTTARYKGH